MITFTIIFSALATTILVIGAVSAIVVKTEVTPNWKRISYVMVWLISILIFRLVFWGLIKYYWQEKVESSVITQKLCPIATWVFHWSMLLNERTKNGHTDSTFSADVTKDDGVMLWVDLYDEHGVLVSNLRMRKEGDRLVGKMNNLKDGEGGDCYLTTDSTGWVGQITWAGYSPIACSLKK